MIFISYARHISALTEAEVEFGLIPKEHWIQPPWIDEEKASAAREDMVKQNVIYGGTGSSSKTHTTMSFNTPLFSGSVSCVGNFPLF